MQKLRKTNVQVAILLGVVVVGLGAYLYHTTVTSAETVRTIGTLSFVAVPVVSAGTEYVEMSYLGAGAYDLNDAQLLANGEVVHTFNNIQIPSGERVRSCGIAGADVKCNVQWNGGIQLPDANSSITLRTADGSTPISVRYDIPEVGERITTSTDVNALVYTENDSVPLCHSGNDKKYTKSKSNAKTIANGKAHATHVDTDIIPPFFYLVDGQLGYFGGMNWDTGAAQFEAGC